MEAIHRPSSSLIRLAVGTSTKVPTLTAEWAVPRKESGNLEHWLDTNDANDARQVGQLGLLGEVWHGAGR